MGFISAALATAFASPQLPQVATGLRRNVPNTRYGEHHSYI
jgi:hypothetical protein